MPINENRVPERRMRSVTMVQKLVEVRSDMLSLYSELAERKPYHDVGDDFPEVLADFCASLIDYTANAHFQLYRYFAEKKERRQRIIDVADKIYPRIVDITQSILDFNDKYDSDQQRQNLCDLEKDLSVLGEALAERIELEDNLIDVLSSSGK
ncbi:MAG: sigma D regulator [Gammaproteobacteria bacterium]|nr:sigma D regulator [Gammaproteobacteria bacterium]